MHYIAMELVEGENLAQRITAGGCLRIDEALAAWTRDRKPREAELYLFADGFDEPGSGAEYVAGLAIQRHRMAKSVAQSPGLYRPNIKPKSSAGVSPGDAVEAAYYCDDTGTARSDDYSDDDLAAQFDGHNDDGWRDKMNGGAE